MSSRIAVFATTFILAKGALCQDIAPDRVEYLSDLADQIYQHHAKYLVIYQRGLAVTTYCGAYAKASLFDINWFGVELGEEFQTICSIQCNNISEETVLRNFIKKKFYGNVDGFVDPMHVQHSDNHQDFCDNSQDVIDYLFEVANSRVDEEIKMKSPPE